MSTEKLSRLLQRKRGRYGKGGAKQRIRALRESGTLVSSHHDKEAKPVDAVRIKDIEHEHGHVKIFPPREWHWLKGRDWYLGGAQGSYFIALVRPDEYEPEEPLRGEDGEPARFGSREEASEAAEGAAGCDGEYRVEYVEP